MKFLFLMLMVLAAAQAQYRVKTAIAHRGASSYAPENTLPAYRLAIQQGAEFVEQDLQITRDGVLVCLHDSTLERTTDVAQVFPERARDGRWRVSDFTLAEIKRLDAGVRFHERFRGTRIPTFQEAIDEVRGKAGLYPETKAPDVYGKLGFDMERMVLEVLRKNGLERPGADPKTPVVIQSFSAEGLRKLTNELGSRLPHVFLVGVKDKARWTSEGGLREMKAFAAGIGAERSIVRDDPELPARAHKLGLSVTIWTLKDEREEMARFLKLGVDAIFTNNPDRFPR